MPLTVTEAKLEGAIMDPIAKKLLSQHGASEQALQGVRLSSGEDRKAPLDTLSRLQEEPPTGNEDCKVHSWVPHHTTLNAITLNASDF